MLYYLHKIKIKMNTNITEYHAKYFAHELTKRSLSNSLEKLSSTLSNAQVDMNPHQIEAALFAFKSPLSKGAILADEVGLGKTIEAGLVLSQKWAEDKKKSMELDLKQLEIDIKSMKTTSKKILNLEEKIKIQREIKNLEKKRNEMRQRLFISQDEVDFKKDELLDKVESQLKQETKLDKLFSLRFKII